MAEEEDFERPPLTEHLRQILAKYPDGQIHKVDWKKFSFMKHKYHTQETIQNAEDAGAAKWRLILDERQFGEKSLFNTEDGKRGFASMQVN